MGKGRVIVKVRKFLRQYAKDANAELLEPIDRILPDPYKLGMILRLIQNSVTEVESISLGHLAENRTDIKRIAAAARLIREYYRSIDEIEPLLLHAREQYILLPQKAESMSSQVDEIAGRTIRMIEESRIKVIRDFEGPLLKDATLSASLKTHKFPKKWEIAIQGHHIHGSGIVTSRFYYFLVVLAFERKLGLEPLIKRGFPLEAAAIEELPDRLCYHLIPERPYAWIGDPKIAGPDISLSDQQSKIKTEINQTLGAEIIIYRDDCYRLHPAIHPDHIKIDLVN